MRWIHFKQPQSQVMGSVNHFLQLHPVTLDEACWMILSSHQWWIDFYDLDEELLGLVTLSLNREYFLKRIHFWKKRRCQRSALPQARSKICLPGSRKPGCRRHLDVSTRSTSRCFRGRSQRLDPKFCPFFPLMCPMQDGAFEVKKAGNKMRKFVTWSLLVLDVIICNVVNFLRWLNSECVMTITSYYYDYGIGISYINPKGRLWKILKWWFWKETTDFTLILISVPLLWILHFLFA